MLNYLCCSLQVVRFWKILNSCETYHPGVAPIDISPQQCKRQEETKFKKELGQLQVVCCMLEERSFGEPSFAPVLQECENMIMKLNGKDGVQEKFTKWYLKISDEDVVDEKAKDQATVQISSVNLRWKVSCHETCPYSIQWDIMQQQFIHWNLSLWDAHLIHTMRRLKFDSSRSLTSSRSRLVKRQTGSRH